MPSAAAQNPPHNTSVFNALGSYADRIKDANGHFIAAPSTGTSPQPTLTSLPGSSSTMTTTPPTKAAPAASSPRSTAVASSSAKPDGKKEAPAQLEEEEVWETVQHPRQRQKNAEDSHSNHKEKKSQANASRNWRERPAKDSKDAKDKDDDEKKRSGSKSSRKAEAGSSSSGPKPSLSSTSVGKTERVLSTSSSKPAWGKVTPVAPATSASATATHAAGPSTSAVTHTPKTATRKASQVEVSTPSVNGSNGPVGAASPALTAETASSATAAASEATKVAETEEEGSWRAKPKEAASQEAEAVTPPSAPSTRPTAPPPSVNAWDLRKKTLTASPVAPTPSSQDPKPGQAASALHFGSVPPSSSSSSKALNGVEANTEDAPKPSALVPSKKKKKAAAAAEGPVILPDSSAWPDIAQAAQVAKKDEEDKERLGQRKKGSENGSVLDDAAATSTKKTKWKSIPAAELQAAVDRQVEQDRKLEAAKKRVNRPAQTQNAPAPSKAKAKKTSVDTRKAPTTPHVPHPLPPQPNGDHSRAPAALPNAHAAPFKPASALTHTRPDGESVASQATDSAVPPTTSGSAPMSRQTSVQSDGTPEHAIVPVSPARSAVAERTPLHAVSSQPMSSSASVPMGQTAFAPVHGAHGLPRIPGKRDGRGSFSNRGGRGAFRGIKGGVTSPVMGSNGLPVDGFGRGYGYGYQGINGMALQYAQGSPQSQGQGGGAYDPTAVQWQMYQRGAAPPPPMPQTPIQGLDVQRFYVLGQVEYYFSMQNLAMDFFLRQQMDSEGWIDISMIASFNRLKSLTPDVAMVKEVMELSSLLEVRDEKVRLSAADFRRWILPDAKASIFPPDPASSSTASPAIESLSQSQEDSEISDVLETLGIPAGLGLEDMNGGASKMVPGGVEGALMKSVPPSSSASVLNGDGDVTPATSMSGREGEEDAAVSSAPAEDKDSQHSKESNGINGTKTESATRSEGVQVELR